MTESNDDHLWEPDFYEIERYRRELEGMEILDATCCGTLKGQVDDITWYLHYLEEQRPDCSRDKVNYETIFAKYKENVDELNSQRKKLLGKLKVVARAKKHTVEGKENIDLIAAFAVNYRDVLLHNDKLRGFIDETKRVISMRINSFQTFTEDQIAESAQLFEKLESVGTVIDVLSTPTHEWKPIEYQSFSLRAARIPTETSSLEGRPEEERQVATNYRCKKCGLEKKVGSDGIS